MDDVKYSIITPVYNRAELIKRCIDSVIEQKRNDTEHIIVDDGSDDGTADILCEYCHIRHLIVQRQKNNLGVNAARNIGIKISKGEFIIFLDSDDILLSNALTTIDKIISKYNYKQYYFLPLNIYNKYKGFELAEINITDWLKGRYEGDFFTVTRSKIQKKYLFNENYNGYESLDMLTLRKATSPQLFIPIPVFKVDIRRNDSLSIKNIPDNFDKLKTFSDVKFSYINKYGLDYLKNDCQKELKKIIESNFFHNLVIFDYEKNIKLIKYVFENKLLSYKIIFFILFNITRLGYFCRLLWILRTR